MKSSKGTAWYLCGPEQAAVITLIHGIGVNRHLWREYEAILSRRYRVLSYDLPGHGESNPESIPLSLTSFTAQLHKLLNELAIDRCAIVGFSMGGMINRHFAMHHPERVRALVILNSPHARSPEAQKTVEDRVALTAAGGAAATIQTSLERWFTPEFLAAETTIVEEVRKWILASDPNSYTQSRSVLARGVRELVSPNPPVSVPALTITCENDSGSTPEMAYGISAEIVGAKTIIVPGLQHLGMLEQPEQFINPIMSFLSEVLD